MISTLARPANDSASSPETDRGRTAKTWPLGDTLRKVLLVGGRCKEFRAGTMPASKAEDMRVVKSSESAINTI